MPSNHLVLCRPLLLLPWISPSIRVFSNESALWLFATGGQSIGASASVLPMNIHDWLPLGLTGLISLQSKRPSRVLVLSRKPRDYKRLREPRTQLGLSDCTLFLHICALFLSLPSMLPRSLKPVIEYFFSQMNIYDWFVFTQLQSICKYYFVKKKKYYFAPHFFSN